MLCYVQDHIKRNIILVGDGYFAKKQLLRMCIGLRIPIISRLQSNAALSHAPKRVKKRGRPAVYGSRLQSLS